MAYTRSHMNDEPVAFEHGGPPPSLEFNPDYLLLYADKSVMQTSGAIPPEVLPDTTFFDSTRDVEEKDRGPVVKQYTDDNYQSSVTEYRDGTKVHQFPPGGNIERVTHNPDRSTVIEYRDDGRVETFYADKRKVTRYKDGSVVEQDPGAAKQVTTTPDGTAVTRHNNGWEETVRPDGSREIRHLSDQSQPRATFSADGTTSIYVSEAGQVTEIKGKTTQLPDGSRVFEDEDKTVRVTFRPDFTSTVEAEDGSFTASADKDGLSEMTGPGVHIYRDPVDVTHYVDENDPAVSETTITPNGTITAHYLDGHQEVSHPDGSLTIVRPGHPDETHRMEATDAAGAKLQVRINQSGSPEAVLKDGTVVPMTAVEEVTSWEICNEKFEIVKPDGSKEIIILDEQSLEQMRTRLMYQDGRSARFGS